MYQLQDKGIKQLKTSSRPATLDDNIVHKIKLANLVGINLYNWPLSDISDWEFVMILSKLCDIICKVLLNMLQQLLAHHYLWWRESPPNANYVKGRSNYTPQRMPALLQYCNGAKGEKRELALNEAKDVCTYTTMLCFFWT